MVFELFFLIVLKDDNKEELGDEQIQIDISLHLANDNGIY